VLRLIGKPSKVTADGVELPENKLPSGNGWIWTALSSGGVLKIIKTTQRNVVIDF